LQTQTELLHLITDLQFSAIIFTWSVAKLTKNTPKFSMLVVALLDLEPGMAAILPNSNQV
jgi:hypothetical protein